MNKEQQNLAWACLPKEARNQIISTYFCKRDSDTEYNKGYVDAILHIYGIHNLTSDTEPVEVLCINKEEFYNFYKLLSYCHNHDSNLYDDLYWQFVKCLPDKKPVHFQPKYVKGDKVKHGESICEIIDTEYSDVRPYCIRDGGCTQWVAESDLEPYSEYNK